jgi:hypothetical protein
MRVFMTARSKPPSLTSLAFLSYGDYRGHYLSFICTVTSGYEDIHSNRVNLVPAPGRPRPFNLTFPNYNAQPLALGGAGLLPGTGTSPVMHSISTACPPQTETLPSNQIVRLNSVKY